MLKYLIIQLDDTAASFCHYQNEKATRKLIPLGLLNEAFFWSMKENLTVQLLYPDYELPAEYKEAILQVDHADIVRSTCEDKDVRSNADVVVFDTWVGINNYQFSMNQAYVIRTTLNDLFLQSDTIRRILPDVSRLNVVVLDIENFDADAEERYSNILDNLSENIIQEYKNGHSVQLNILTDRIMLDKMNNCGAGEESITLAPDGKFYICPGFYLDGSPCVGDIANGLDIKNQQLYRIDHAPICRICDAWQCKRCVWQNKKTTFEVNTPSHEQCVVAHIERNASRRLLIELQKQPDFQLENEIPEISYLDPFDKVIKNNRI